MNLAAQLTNAARGEAIGRGAAVFWPFVRRPVAPTALRVPNAEAMDTALSQLWSEKQSTPSQSLPKQLASVDVGSLGKKG